MSNLYTTHRDRMVCVRMRCYPLVPDPSPLWELPGTGLASDAAAREERDEVASHSMGVLPCTRRCWQPRKSAREV